MEISEGKMNSKKARRQMQQGVSLLGKCYMRELNWPGFECMLGAAICMEKGPSFGLN
jgi:hypothetical protein